MTADDIRVCATTDYELYLTWYRDGSVYTVIRSTGVSECVGRAYSVDDYNELAYERGVMPVGFGRKSKREAV